MGYRSDVRIIMSKKAYEEFKRNVSEHISSYKVKNIIDGSLNSNYDFNLLNNLSVKRETKDKSQIFIGWNELKWYDGYEEVDAIMDSLSTLAAKGYGYRYMRMGEEYDDIESRESNNFKNDSVKELNYIDINRAFYDNEFKEIKKDIVKDERNDER